MIERKFFEEKIREFQIQEYVSQTLSNVGHSMTKVKKTPLGDKVVIYASRPGLVVGRKGSNIKKLTLALKKKFNLENPQVEISEVEQVNLDPKIVAERIASTLERFGSQRFKGVGHKMMSDVMGAGALGIEILISGKIPGSRAKTWRFYQGYLKKCGDISVSVVRKAHASAKLKTGIVGIKVSIMPPDIKLPDQITIKEKIEKVPEVKKEAENKPKQKTKEKKAEKEMPKEEKPKQTAKETPSEKKEGKE